MNKRFIILLAFLSAVAGGCTRGDLHPDDKNYLEKAKAEFNRPGRVFDSTEVLGQLLREAAQRGLPETVNYLIDCGTPTESADCEGRTALHLAVDAGQRDMIILLAGRGAFIEAKTKKGYGLMHLAVLSQQYEMVRFLTAMGVGDMDDAEKRTPRDHVRKDDHRMYDAVDAEPDPAHVARIRKEITKHERVKTVVFESAAESISFSPDGRNAWVCGPREVLAIDSRTCTLRRQLRKLDDGIFAEYCPYGDTLYVIDRPEQDSSGELIMYELTAGFGFQTKAVPLSDWRLSRIRNSVFSSDRKYWWISSEANESSVKGAVQPALFRVDRMTGFCRLITSALREGGLDSYPFINWTFDSLLIQKDEKDRIYVSSIKPQMVSIYQVKGDKVEKEIALPHVPKLMEYSKGKLITTSSSELAVVDVENGKVLHRVPLIGEPSALCTDVAGTNAYLAFPGSNFVYFFDISGGRFTRMLEVVRPLGVGGADADRGCSFLEINCLRWFDHPKRLVGLGYSGYLFFRILL